VQVYWVYMLASRERGTLYIGVTNDLARRVGEHRDGTASAFTRRYEVHRLVWFEQHGDINTAIQREKTLKHYVRDWKINLIERENLHWADLYPALAGVAYSQGCDSLNDGSSGQARG
jgi:putative endonuclease